MIKKGLKKVHQEGLDILSSFKTKDSFTRNFSYLFSGRVITTLLSFAVTPVLTRIYSPEAYGYFAFFNAFVMNFTVVSSLSYDSALVIVDKERKFYNLFFACILLSFLTSFLLLGGLLILYFSPTLRNFINLDNDLPLSLIFLISFGGILYSLTQLQPKWNIRRKQFKHAARVGVINQIISRSTAIILGFFYGAPIYGLVFSELASKINAITINTYKNLIKEWSLFTKAISFKVVIEVLKEQLSYPKYILSGKYIGLISKQIPIFVGAFFFNSEIIGNYGLAISMLILPMNILSNTIQPVILKKVNDSKKNNEDIRSFVIKILNIILILATPFFTLLFIFSEWVFPVIFGEQWILAGQFAKIISVYLIVDIIQVFSGSLYLVYEKQRQLFNTHLSKFLLSVIFILPGIFYENFNYVLIGFGFIYYIMGWYEVNKVLKYIGLRAGYYFSILTVYIGLMLAIYFVT
ncbi:oligosaccharide flippase family protein [Marivirga tractuosa]|uniref:oligosaccharide flippase family protein n=1 Tax=Marivirga tractuosa TaxID=1006 RepID=UPI0035D12A72